MKYKNVIFCALALMAALAVAIYLNRAYAFIYSKFHLTRPPAVQDYMTSNAFTEKSQLLTYVALGDSLTAGVGATGAAATFPALLAERISAANGLQVQVKNFGLPGATSFNFVGPGAPDVARFKPDIVTVFIGTNDVHNFVPLAKFKANLSELINKLKQTTAAEIYLINIPYLGAKDLVLPPYDVYFEIQITEYNEVIAEVSRETGARLIELHDPSAIPFKSDNSLYCLDRFHPSDKGYKLWAEIIGGQIVGK